MSVVIMITAWLLIVPVVFGQELPPAGTVIDKTNYKQYADLFPKEYLPVFETGFNGLMPLGKMVVSKTKQYPMCSEFMEYSKKNIGKYSIDASGNITPKFYYEGLPFPDLKPGDKDFVKKLMWNYDGKYLVDDAWDDGSGGSIEKRRGEKIRVNQASSIWLLFSNRMFEDPKPDLPSANGLYKVFLLNYIKPESIKNTITLSYRFLDQTKPDETYLYLPSMRRVIRAEAGQRSTPVTGSASALDDFTVFDGRTPDFTYTLVGEQKVLGVPNSMLTPEKAREFIARDELPVDVENYEVRDCYVIDITPKDPKYPQSKKRIYLDKETLWAYYGIAWDRAGNLWKIWTQPTKSFSMPNGEKIIYNLGQMSIDLQFGMATQYVPNYTINTNRFSYADVTPQSLLKRAR